MIPKIALVGRPNVGKSALFNRIVKKRLSIVDSDEGITRDRLYTESEFFGAPFILIDTGGVDFSEKIPFAKLVREQAELAMNEADAMILVVDGRIGPTPFDEEMAKILRKTKKPLFIAINKMDCGKDLSVEASFLTLGIPSVFSVSAIQGFQIAELLEAAMNQIPKHEEPEETKDAIQVAIVGRANVGKSTLLNHLLSEERSIVSPIAGTTRDAIDVLFEAEGQKYLLIDTAGIRRKKAEKEVVDKFAAIRTDEAIERADVCLLILDSVDGMTTQEKRIAREIEERGKSCILLFNKWDLMKNVRMEHAFQAAKEEASFLNHCPTLFISATLNRNLEKILPLVKDVYANRKMRLSTGALNTFVEKALQKYHPPLITGKRLRIYYLTQVETNPPKFVLFVNKPDLMTESYRKYLINQLRHHFPFSGTPIQFHLRGKGAKPQKAIL